MNFLNDLGWTNSKNESCRSQEKHHDRDPASSTMLKQKIRCMAKESLPVCVTIGQYMKAILSQPVEATNLIPTDCKAVGSDRPTVIVYSVIVAYIC